MVRSWWGWGTEEAALSGVEERELVGAVRALLPGADLTRHDPPDPRVLVPEAPRLVAPEALAHLCTADARERAGHARGKAFRDVVRNLEGVVGPVPDLVAYPETEEQVADLLDWCSGAGAAVIPYGGGSSVVGGVEPRHGGPALTLDLSRMRRVLEVDAVSRAASVQAGVLGPDLEGRLRGHGLTLRHYPQSFEFSSLGGWLATRAAGHYATGPTHIDDHVESLRVLTPAGVVESARLPASGAGPSPDRMFLGSEGTLGVITRAWMRVRERPRWRAGASVSFPSFALGVAAVRELAASGLEPAGCRLLDPAEALINANSPHTLLVLGLESADHPVQGALERAVAICAGHGGTAETGGGGGRWRSAFLRMPYQRDALARRSVIAETFETSCTWDRFEELHAAVTAAAREAIEEVCGGAGVLTCRFTHVYPDGPAPYYGFYAQGRWGSMVGRWDEVKARVSQALADHGGSITHHHAVGRDHRPWYDRQRPDLFAAAMGAAKRELDPAGVLNPGVLWG
ncbi:FAD-binding oxidoreductase [Nocardiopsis protaetiae]|uniref:FAD-binding oxidoreductase n=1 Tax=Nocardiopsis protaetiae TaxID=3382270 RepID=UPI00387B3E67